MMPPFILAGLLCLAPGESPSGAIAEQIRRALPSDLMLTELVLPAGVTRDQEVSIEWRRAVRPGTTALPLLVHGAGGLRRHYARVRLAPAMEVAVASRDLSPDVALTASDFRMERRPREGGAASAFEQVLAGARLAFGLRAGDVIRRSDLLIEPPVTRGAQVEVVSRIGAAEVRTRGRLERSTPVGERAEVRLEVGGRVVRGTLRDRTTVTVSEVKP